MGVVGMAVRSNISPVRELIRNFLPDVLDDYGVSSSRFLASLGRGAGSPLACGAECGYPRMADLLRRAAEFADCEHLGLLLGQAGHHSLVEGLGPGVARAPTVGAALMAIRSQFSSQERGAIVEFTTGDMACLSYIVVDPAVDSAAVVSDVAGAAALRVLSELCGSRWSPELVELPRRPPRDLRPYRRLFKCPIAFNATMVAIHFRAAWLDAPLAAGGNVGCAKAPPPLQASGAPDMVECVTQQLARSIASGAAVSAGKVARLFGMCGRTLQRELTKARTSYRSLSDDVRFGMARRLLQDTDMPVTEIALALGYADASVLTRAFTRWAGTCPSEWRASNRLLRRPTAAAPCARILPCAGDRLQALVPSRA
ncbi:MAG: hypothetical protein DI527_02340 [Chelatococcus sp.]|nr:MAG: hypothetical protein DI527_02340 [Chelatococcus sp.]